MEANHKPVDVVKKGAEVCLKIDPIPGEAPRLLGRHFDEADLIVSKVRRLNILVKHQLLLVSISQCR